ncbi:MAG: hypothetical protein IAF38_17405 [Bacteroidia bacterium]|nr:hypothetical protein [Bacteroidia bacterium]
MKNFRVIFIFFIFSGLHSQTLPIKTKKIRTRTTYYSETNSKLRTIDSFSVDGLLMKKSMYDYRSFPVVSSGAVRPGPVGLIGSVVYKYDSLKRCVYEYEGSFFFGTYQYVYEDSGRTILKQSPHNFKRAGLPDSLVWLKYEKCILTIDGDTALLINWSGSQIKGEPSFGWKYDFEYENGRVVNWKSYNFNNSSHHYSEKEKWDLYEEKKHYYSSFPGPDSVVYFGNKNDRDGVIIYKYDSQKRKVEEVNYNGDQRTDYKWIYNTAGQCVLINSSFYRNGKCTEVKNHTMIYNKYGLIEKEFTPGTKSEYRHCRYTYY